MSNPQLKNDKPSVSLKITKAIRESGFLALNSPQEFQTLITLCTFASKQGKVKVSSKALAFALNLSQKQAQYRLKRVCNLRWKGKPLVIKESNKARFTPSDYRLMLPEGLMLIPEGLPAPSEAPTCACTAYKRQTGDFLKQSGCMEAKREEGLPSSSALQRSEEEVKGNPVTEVEVGRNNVVVNNNILNTTTKDKQRLFGLLKAEGVTEYIAKELVEKYPQKQIIAQLKMLPYRRAQNPAGMLIKAIKENWAPPQDYQGIEEWEAQRARQRAENERRAKEIARRRIYRQKIEEIKARMSKEELTKLRERAKQKIARLLRGAYGDNLPEILIDAEMSQIIAMKYLKEK